MQKLKDMLSREENRLKKIVKQTREQLKNAPEGSMRLTSCHGHPQFYQKVDGSKKSGIYIPRGNEELIKALAQKSYDEKVLKQAEKRLAQIQRITKDYNENEIEQIYLNEHPKRQELIKPVEQTWEQQFNEWKNKEYKGNDFQEGTPVILTEKGERVRSKSEKIMADYFYRNGIEYKYECPIQLQGLGTVYPDFTFLSRKTREEIYWEHNGKTDDPKYARRMVRKINAYERNGIFVGENLILTFETEQIILNTGKIEQLVKKYL